MLGLEIALGLAVVALVLFYLYLTATFSHWKDKGVKFIRPLPLVGSMLPVFTLQEHMLVFFQRAYRRYRCEPYVGFYQARSPALLIRDPELVKAIFIKDFTHFTDHGFRLSKEIDPLPSRNLFNMEGYRWKEMRAKLTPTFTSGRMKAMFPLVQECALKLETYLGNLAGTGEEFDMQDLMARFTTDVIASCAFGVQCDSINDPNALFRVMGRKLFSTDIIMGLKLAMLTFAPEIAEKLKIGFLTEELNEFFRTLVHDVMVMRARTGETRKDFMQLLIDLKDRGKLSPEEEETGERNNYLEEPSEGDNRITDDDVTAQAMAFFTAGFVTSSMAMTFALFELARRPDLQDNARSQIEEVLERHDGQMSYQALLEMTYLDWILQESLRMYPPICVLFRKCTKNFVIPGTKVTIEHGTQVLIPIHALQNDPLYFPSPETFEPERFSDENIIQKTKHVYMPFGEGPRQCIGLRFGRMQSKLGLATVLRSFEVQPSPSTKYPLTFDPRQFLLVSKENVLLKLARVET